MLDFTSALYLGMWHPSATLRPWERLTTGKPAALFTSSFTARVANSVGRLIGTEQAVLGPSTLHLFWDLFSIFPTSQTIVFMDKGIYPIIGWGIERAKTHGMPIRVFSHFSVRGLMNVLQRNCVEAQKPVIVTDGWCSRCGQPAPLRAYAQFARKFGGVLIIDDTQAMGILGANQTPLNPYGGGGGGSLRWHGLRPGKIVVVNSLAKAFGVPIAVLGGSKDLVRTFQQKSETRVHCSPPSAAMIHATEQALRENQRWGDSLRSRLLHLVSRFRSLVKGVSIPLVGGPFPVQSLQFSSLETAERAYGFLLNQGIKPILNRSHLPHQVSITFCITARHTIADVTHAAAAVKDAMKTSSATVARKNSFDY